MAKTECFKIQLLRNKEPGNWDVRKMDPIHQILNDKARFALFPTIIVADPFLFVHKGRLCLFYEAKKYGQSGVIKMQYTDDLITWSKPVTVLKEKFHLSFPYVFEDGGGIYMVPETCAAREVRLYKADDESLTHFTYHKTLVEHNEAREDIEIDFSDSIIYKHNGNYYLFTTIKGKDGNELYIYTSSHIEGPFLKHPSSPVDKSMKYGRNGGCIIKKGDSLFRVAQDCVKRYGDNVHVMKIDELNNKSYSEHLQMENIIPLSVPFYAEGGHQFYQTVFQGYTIVATDAKEYHEYPLAHKMYKLGRIPHKLFGK